jgi:hypothetical protein
VNTIARQMPAYKSHKTVWALKIAAIDHLPNPDETGKTGASSYGAIITPQEEGYGPFPVDSIYVNKHQPEVGGYYVQYADGYKSFSPANAFEDGYKPEAGPANRELLDHAVGANEGLSIGVLDLPGHGGANHQYMVESGDFPQMLQISFQNGPIAEVGVNGVTHEALLAIVADRLRSFQKGPYSCKANACALTHIEEAMHWLQQRTIERMRRGVEGTHKV